MPGNTRRSQPARPASPSRRSGRALDSQQLALFDNSALGTPPPASGPLRRVLLGGQPVDWALRRARRRTIGFVIDHRGLRVSAPRWVTLGEIERALVEKGDWILRKLAEWREHDSRRERLSPRWENGAPLRLLGRLLTMRIDPATDGVRLAGDELRVGLPAGAHPERMRDLVQSWLQQQAKERFAERIPVFAERLGHAPTRWSLSSARTRWGSCSADGSIRLNWRLVHFPPAIVDYVIAHELAHLREMNHGPRFWATVGTLFPEFEQARDWLRRIPNPGQEGGTA
jgi:predicted metal-dependent hydrolase